MFQIFQVQVQVQFYFINNNGHTTRYLYYVSDICVVFCTYGPGPPTLDQSRGRKTDGGTRQSQRRREERVPPPSLASLVRPADGCFGLNALWNL